MRLNGTVLLMLSARVSAIALGAATITAGPAWGQAAQVQEVDLSVPAGQLGQALAQFGEQAGVSLVYPAELARDRNTAGVTGKMSIEDGLSRLLGGTGLSFRRTGPRTISIQPAPAATTADGTHVLSPVRVEGAQGDGYFGRAGQAAGVNGINGSRDITATEGTKSFTSGALTIGSKVPQALKDVPQTVSVLTNERLQQQNITDFTTVMRQLPGITLVQGGNNLQNTFYSRGYAITSVQVDGGAPLMIGGQALNPQIDMSNYDHVELLRGADGLFNGYGDPSGSINLVRKKPLDHQQFTLDGQVGSWDNYRLVADATSPLALDGRLRGRLVTTWQSNHHFYQTAKDSKYLIYGIAEFDVTPTTLLTAGVDYSKQDSVPWLQGLPRYQTGADLKLPRSTSFVFPWNRWNFNSTELFGAAEQKIGKDWTFKVNVTHVDQKSTEKAGYSVGAVNPSNNRGPVINADYFNYGTKQWSIEGTLSGSFSIFGQRQEVVAGLNHSNVDNSGYVTYGALIDGEPGSPYQPYPGGPTFCRDVTCTVFASAPPINVFNFNPNDPNYNEPANILPGSRYPEFGQATTVAYLNVRLTAFDRLHLNTGIRWTKFSLKSKVENLCKSIPATGPGGPGSCYGLNIGDPYSTSNTPFSGHNFSWPPTINLSFDATKSLTAYFGYTDIYQSQAFQLDANHNPLAPLTGSNIEGGLKWAPRGGRINLSIAAYRTRKKGYALTDPSVPFQQLGPNLYCCYVSNPNRSQVSEGVDAEATGEILPGWQVAGSLTYNKTKFDGSFYKTREGLPFLSIQPKVLYKLWTSYDFGSTHKSGVLSGLTISGGVNGQSSGFYSGSVCVNLGPPNPITGVSNCVSGHAPDTVPFSFTVAPYAVFSGRVDYAFSKSWSLSMNLENILDKTYYQTVGSNPLFGNWYGTPRSVTFALHAKW